MGKLKVKNKVAMQNRILKLKNKNTNMDVNERKNFF